MEQREIKFRAWDGEAMIELKNAGLQYFDFEGSYALSFAVDGYSGFWAHEQYESASKKAAKFPIMQYIGLKDKNGVEIYESDIVEVHIFTQELGYNLGVTEGEKVFKGVVEFWEYGIGLNVGDAENNFYLVLAPGMLHEESFEILGNKFSNPELTQQS